MSQSAQLTGKLYFHPWVHCGHLNFQTAQTNLLPGFNFIGLHHDPPEQNIHYPPYPPEPFMHRGHQDPHISVSRRRHYIWASASSFSKCWISRSGGFESGVLRTTQEWADKGQPGQPLDWNKQLWFHKQQFDRLPKKKQRLARIWRKKQNCLVELL